MSCIGIWQWANGILVPAYTERAVTRGRPIGNNSDLYPVWLTSKEVLLERKAPYTQQLTSDIQKGFYGRDLDEKDPNDPKDLQAFAYPLYAIFLLAPTITFQFAVVAQFFRWILLLSTACSVPLWMRAICFQRKWLFTVTAILLIIGSFPSVLENRQQNLSALVVLLLAGSFAARTQRRFILSGFLLALSTIKPQLSVFLIVWMLLMVRIRWKELSKLGWSFIVTLSLLCITATAVSPGWVKGFWFAISKYRTYALGPSILQVLLPMRIAFLLIFSLIFFLGLLLWKNRTAQPGSTAYAGVLAAVVTTTVVLANPAAHYQLLLFPALLMLLGYENHNLKNNFLARVLTRSTFACLFWQWGTASILSLCSLFITTSKLAVIASLPLATLAAMPLLALLAIAVLIFPDGAQIRTSHQFFLENQKNNLSC